MADSFVSKLITELVAKTTAADTDLVPVADSNGNFFKMTWQKMKQLLLGTKDISGVGDGTVTGAISELNTKKVSMSYKNENLTCTAGVIREYVFQGIPTHRISFPVLTGASTNINGCIVYRDTNVTGKIRVYSPINQDVSVMLIILI